MGTYPKFVELTADVVGIILLNPFVQVIHCPSAAFLTAWAQLSWRALMRFRRVGNEFYHNKKWLGRGWLKCCVVHLEYLLLVLSITSKSGLRLVKLLEQTSIVLF